MSDRADRVAAILDPLASAIDFTIKSQAGEELPFILMLAVDGVCMRVSNMSKETRRKFIEHLLEGWDEAVEWDAPKIPANRHKH